MAFPKNLLNDNEELVLDLRPHWFFMFEPTISLVGAIVFGILVLLKGPSGTFGNIVSLLSGALVLGVLVWFGVRYARWVSTNFVVTSDRVVFRKGVLAKQGIEIPLERINTVFFNQSIFERMLGAGDLGIESAGERGMETFEDVRKPSLVQNEIYRQMEANNHRMYGGVRSGDAPAPAMPPTPAPSTPGTSIAQQLHDLDELRQKGVITEAEFAAKKAQLLDRM